MTVVAGVDVGNSTTEAVVARVAVDGSVEPVAWDRAITRGGKGSATSVTAAAALLRRLERQSGARPDLVAVAPMRPVATQALVLPEPRSDTGRLVVAVSGAATAGGRGHGVGRPVLLTALADRPSGDVVALVHRGPSFEEVAEQVSRAMRDGVLVRAVVLEGDDGVLVAHRIPEPVPVVDQADVAALAGCQLVVVEVAPPGHPVRALGDALHLTTALGLSRDDASSASTVARSLFDCSNAAVGVLADAPAPAVEAPTAWLDRSDGGRVQLHEAAEWLAATAPGAVTALGLPTARGEHVVQVDDVGVVDLARIADTVVTRVGGTASRSFGVAALHREPALEAAGQLSEQAGIPVVTIGSEASASRLGALTTPGTADDSAVVDLGGGTVDVITADHESVVAGAGDLLTVAVAALLGIPRGAAEWVKRTPCFRADSPHLLVGEDGSRTFLDRPLPGDHVGSLLVQGPAGWLPFHRGLAVSEWRAVRLALKRDVLGRGVRRAWSGRDDLPSTVVLVGGPAGDDEVVAAVARALPDSTAVGRGQVAGQLGHRYSVAFGLAMAAGGRNLD